MRLVTYQDGTAIHTGALRGDDVIALDSVAPDLLSLIDGGPAALEKARALVADCWRRSRARARMCSALA
jgi:hypothetical protein